MARRSITLHIDASPEVAFAYLEDFSNAPRWDPGVADATRLDDGPIGLGSRFDLGLLIAGKVQRWTYVVEAHDAPRHVTFATRTNRATGIDDVTVTPAASGGSTVVWDASFTFAGVLGRLADPLFQPVFSRIVAKAVDGLEDALRSLPAEV